MRRTVRYGTAWHPNRIRPAWLRDVGMPQLQKIAAQEKRPMPGLCPRIRLKLTAAPMVEDQRVMGEGTVDQVRRDMEALQALGCSHVLLDTFYDDVEATRHPETAWHMYTTMAERVLDLRHETLK